MPYMESIWGEKAHTTTTTTTTTYGSHIEVIDKFMDNAKCLRATEADYNSLCLLEHEGDIAHHVGETCQVIDGHTNVAHPSTKGTPQVLHLLGVLISILYVYNGVMGVKRWGIRGLQQHTLVVMYNRLCRTTLVPSGEPHPLPVSTEFPMDSTTGSGTCSLGCTTMPGGWEAGASSTSSTFCSHGTMYCRRLRFPEGDDISKRSTISGSHNDLILQLEVHIITYNYE